MAATGHGLMIKYGLKGAPSSEKVQEWLDLANHYVSEGFSEEDAGNKAAEVLFPSYQTHLYASEADSIVSLLGQARDKK